MVEILETGRASGPGHRRFHDRTAVVTGASKGIGRTICVELAREGARIVAVGGKDKSGIEQTLTDVRAVGSDGVAMLADVTSISSVRLTFERIADEFGSIDTLVNNAGGGGGFGPLEEISEPDWDRAFALNTKSAFLCSSAAARLMKASGGGSIVNIAGASAHRSYPGHGGFGPSKAALISLTRQASLEWAPYGIRVNGVSPGAVRDRESGWEKREPALAREVALLPIPRAATRREIALAVAYLASEEAAYTTGQMLVVDGGGINTWYLSLSDRWAPAVPDWDQD